MPLHYKFIDYPPAIEHQGTGDIDYTPYLVLPGSVRGNVVSRSNQTALLTFQSQPCKISVLCMTVDGSVAPNWYGIAFRREIAYAPALTSINIFFHPSPSNAGMNDRDYPSRGGRWSALFRYAQNLGFQLGVACSNQILIVPFFSNASYSTGGIFAQNWKEILWLIMRGVSLASTIPAASRTSLDLEVLAQQFRADSRVFDQWNPDIVLSAFSYGRVLMDSNRRRMAGLGQFLREIWDFNGVGPVPIYLDGVKTVSYDQDTTNNLLGFHVPLQRWSNFRPPGGPPPPTNFDQVHGLIPNMLMWHAACESNVGKSD